MTDQEILDNAPEGASVSDITGEYFDEYNNHLNKQGFWSEKDTSPVSPRSLKDIRRIVELENKNAKMLECLCDISNACIGQLTMSYSLDSDGIGRSIYESTGMTNPELNAALKEQVKL